MNITFRKTGTTRATARTTATGLTATGLTTAGLTTAGLTTAGLTTARLTTTILGVEGLSEGQLQYL
ncbi:hypothetical protein C3E96_003825 [Klebsiella pneumoniae]|nr:hypothetical protein C3E96_003825 [Klebsiella pneumoniae]